MAFICGKRLNFVGNDLDLLETAQYVINGFHVLEMAEICGKWVRNMIDGFRVLEMSEISVKWLRNVVNGIILGPMP